MKKFYWWCLHCEQAFFTLAPKYPNRCHVPGCDGSSIDLRSWQSHHDLHPNHPEIPSPGVVYGLYDFTGGGEKNG